MLILAYTSDNLIVLSIMLSVKEAARNALDFYKEIYPDTQGELIEEVELDSDRHHWLITLSFISKVEPKNPLFANVLVPQFERKYKLFKVNADSGMVESMKIRVLGNDLN